jgi:hypothetical protein
MTPPAIHLKYRSTLLLWVTTFCLLSSIHLYGQADAPGNFQEMVPGLLGRTVFKTDAKDIRIEIMDILVGPGKASEPIVLKSGALLDVQGGEAVLIVDGKPHRVKPGGNAVSFAQGQTIMIDNRIAPRSLVARLILFSRPGR